MMRAAAFVVIGELALILSGCGQVVSDTKDDSFWSRILIVPEQRINLTNAKAISNQFLDEVADLRRIVCLSILSSTELAALQSQSCESYRGWKAAYANIPKDPLAAADLIAIGPKALLRLREP